MFTWFKVHYSNPRLDIEVWKGYKRDKKRDISRAPRISSLSLLCLSFRSDEVLLESIVGYEKETGQKTK